MIMHIAQSTKLGRLHVRLKSRGNPVLILGISETCGFREILTVLANWLSVHTRHVYNYFQLVRLNVPTEMLLGLGYMSNQCLLC